jgi:hypothetical protein
LESVCAGNRTVGSNPTLSAIQAEKLLFLSASQSWRFGGPYFRSQDEALRRLEYTNPISLKGEPNKGNTRARESPRHVSRDLFIVGQDQKTLTNAAWRVVVDDDLPDCGVQRLTLAARFHFI